MQSYSQANLERRWWGCLQNLMEFFVVITKKVENPIDIVEAGTIVVVPEKVP